jgi:predicted hydrolase (HD superfamily)
MSETSLKNILHNLDYELYSEDYSMNQVWQFGSKSEEEINAEIEENVSNNTKKTCESIWKQFSRLLSFVKNYIAEITSGITDTISTSGNFRSNFLKPW